MRRMPAFWHIGIPNDDDAAFIADDPFTDDDAAPIPDGFPPPPDESE